MLKLEELSKIAQSFEAWNQDNNGSQDAAEFIAENYPDLNEAQSFAAVSYILGTLEGII